MPRMVFAKGLQGQFLTEIKQIMNAGTEDLALNCGVLPRRIRDWQREKYLISEEEFQARRAKILDAL